MSLLRDKSRAWEDFLAGRERAASGPFRASIEVTRNCGLRCVMCEHSWRPEYRRRDPGLDMAPAVLEMVVRELFPFLERVNFQGYGETTVSPHWTRFLDLCEPFAGRLGFELVTNLVRRDDALWLRMAGLGFRFFVSCDGATEETFQAIRVGSRLGAVLSNLELLRRAGGPAPVLLATLQASNVRELPLFVDLAARAGAGRVIFSTVAAAGGWRGAAGKAAAWLRLRPAQVRTVHSLPRELLASLVGRALERSRELGIPIEFTDAALAAPEGPAVPLESLGPEAGILRSMEVCRNRRCFKPYSTVVVDYRGEVGLCNHLLSDEQWEPMGSLLRQPLGVLWNSAAYRRARARLSRGRPAGAACRWCLAHRLAE